MTKAQIKRELAEENKGLCVFSNIQLPVNETSLYDATRKKPKRENGELEKVNADAADPVARSKVQQTYREREQETEKLKTMIDDRRQMMKLFNKINNQLLAYKRKTDISNIQTANFLKGQLDSVSKELNNHDKKVTAQVKRIDHPLIHAALSVKGIGHFTVAHCFVYIDIAGVFPQTQKDKTGKEIPHPRAGHEKCRHASSLWAYTGLDKPSHSRYEKGVAGGGNKTLRTALYTMADSQVKTRGAYRGVYDNIKNRLEHSDRIVKSRDTAGKLVEIPWKKTKKIHRHGAALRAVMKHFLADYWYVGRTLAGLPTSNIWAEEHLGGNHKTILPEERGWIY